MTFDAQTVRVLKRLLRDLVYRDLEAVIGREVWVLHEAHLGPAVADQVWLAKECELIAPSVRAFRAMSVKYGIVDLTFRGPRTLFDVVPASGESRRELRELGLGFLTDVVDQIVPDACLIKVLLTSPPVPLRPPQMLQLLEAQRLPPDYLPRRFVIEDACLTNCGAVWLNKHFYL